MDYAEEMAWCMNYTSVHWDKNAPCEICGGTGLRAVLCCSGSMCGCKGMPVDFESCDCGAEPPVIPEKAND